MLLLQFFGLQGTWDLNEDPIELIEHPADNYTLETALANPTVSLRYDFSSSLILMIGC